MRLELHRKEQRKEQRSSLICIFWAPISVSLNNKASQAVTRLAYSTVSWLLLDGSNANSSTTAPLFHHLFRLLLYLVGKTNRLQMIFS